MTKVHAFGTAIAWDPAGGSSYSTIGQVRTIAAPTLTRETVDVTTHDSANMWREFIKSVKDGGEVTFGIIYDPALGTHDAGTGLLSDFAEDETIATWQLTFPDTGATVWTFPGIVTGMPVEANFDGELGAEVTIKVSGEPTLA